MRPRAPSAAASGLEGTSDSEYSSWLLFLLGESSSCMFDDMTMRGIGVLVASSHG